MISVPMMSLDPFEGQAPWEWHGHLMDLPGVRSGGGVSLTAAGEGFSHDINANDVAGYVRGSGPFEPAIADPSLTFAWHARLLVHAILGVRAPERRFGAGSDFQDRMDQQDIIFSSSVGLRKGEGRPDAGSLDQDAGQCS